MNFSKIKEFCKVAVSAIKSGFVKYTKLIFGSSSLIKKILFIGGGIILPAAFAAKEVYENYKKMDPKPKTIVEHSLSNDDNIKDEADVEIKNAVESIREDMTKNIYGKKMYKKYKKYTKKSKDGISVTEKKSTNSLRDIYYGNYDPNGFTKSYSIKEIEDMRQDLINMVDRVKARRNRPRYSF